MKTRRIVTSCSLTGLLYGLLCAGLHAGTQEISRSREAAPRPAEAAPQRPAPERTAPAISAARPATPVDSTARDLQRIVVLCATEPQSDAFKSAWSKYVEEHGVTAAELDTLIDDVLERAAAWRPERASDTRTNRSLTILTTTTRQTMHDTAMAVIRKIG